MIEENIYALNCKATYGPSFGDDDDIHISNDFIMESYSNLGGTYTQNVGSAWAKSHLAGAYIF